MKVRQGVILDYEVLEIVKIKGYNRVNNLKLCLNTNANIEQMSRDRR